MPDLPGGNYRATQNQDGTWNLFDVPIMAVGPMRMENGEEFQVDEAWLNRALVIGRSRETEGYASPLHVNHHETGLEVQGAGQFVLRYLKTSTLDGKPTPLLYANLIGILPYVYERIRMRALAYRSFESLNMLANEVDSLALMAHQPPRFKLPLLTIGSETPYSSTGAPLPTLESLPRLAVAAARPRTPYAVFAEAKTMTDEEKKAEEAKKAAAAKAADDAAKKDGDKKPSDDDEKGPKWAQALAAAIAAGFASLSAKAGDDGKKEPAQAPPTGQPANAAAAAANADLLGRVIATEGQVAKLANERAEEESVKAALATLKGRSIAATAETELRTMFRAHGKSGLDALTASIKRYAPLEPTSGDPLGASGAADPNLPAAVLAYGKEGPEVLAKAVKVYREVFVPLDGAIDIPLDRFLVARLGTGAKA